MNIQIRALCRCPCLVAIPATLAMLTGLIPIAGADDSTTQPRAVLMLDAARFPDAPVDTRDKASEVRRGRFALHTDFSRQLGFQVEYEFAGDDPGFRDTYLSLRKWNINTFYAGNLLEPLSIDALTYLDDNLFMERALINTLTPGRNPGFMWQLSIENWHTQTSLFFEENETASDRRAGLGFTRRSYIQLKHAGERRLHLGYAYTVRDYPDNQTLRFDPLPESNLAPGPLVDTGDITDVNVQYSGGIEFALTRGRLTAVGEYLRTRVGRQDRRGLDFSGWYASVGWMVTDDTRRYNFDRGTLGTVLPRNPVSVGGPGAWELAARLSDIDLTDHDITGGEQRNLTLGINWYPAHHFKVQFNYVNVLHLRTAGGDAGDSDPDLYQVRAQVSF